MTSAKSPIGASTNFLRGVPRDLSKSKNYSSPYPVSPAGYGLFLCLFSGLITVLFLLCRATRPSVHNFFVTILITALFVLAGWAKKNKKSQPANTNTRPPTLREPSARLGGAVSANSIGKREPRAVTALLAEPSRERETVLLAESRGRA